MLPVALSTAAGFAVLLIALHIVKPDFDPSRRMMSEYAIGRHGWVMRLAFVVWALSFLSLAGALWGREPALGVILLAIVSIGLLGAAVFTTDSVDTPREAISNAGRAHAGFGILFIFGFPIAAALLAFMSGSALKPWLIAMAVVVWISIAAFMGATVRAAALGPGRGRVGWANRLFVACYTLWVVVIALAAVRTA